MCKKIFLFTDGPSQTVLRRESFADLVTTTDVSSHGDVVLLDFATNKEYKHGLHRTRRHVGVRYSITARCIDTFFDPQRRLVRTREDATVRAY